MSATIHAACVVLGEAAVVIMGRSGSGKSRLAQRLVALVSQQGGHAQLIGDDRIRLTAHGGRVIARGHPAIANRAEVRELGVLDMDMAASGVVTLVVELSQDHVDRLPPEDGRWTTLADTRLPVLLLSATHPAEDAARLVLLKIRA